MTAHSCCQSPDRYTCWALRHFGHARISAAIIRFDGGPCKCARHDKAERAIARATGKEPNDG